jgi:hypothetical protein
MPRQLSDFIHPPLQLELNFGNIFKFKDAIRSISRKHGSRGSVLMACVSDSVEKSDTEFVHQNVNGILTDEDERLAQEQLDHAIDNYVDPKLLEAS